MMGSPFVLPMMTPDGSIEPIMNIPFLVDKYDIRPATPDDRTGIIAVASELFPDEETGILESLLANYFGGDDGGTICALAVGSGRAGVVYYAPAIAADRVWDLTMIAVDPERQRQGLGTALLHHVETALRADGQRLLLVETSGLPRYEQTRMFYAKHGFEREARIRDFYAAGDDKIVFRKALQTD